MMLEDMEDISEIEDDPLMKEIARLQIQKPLINTDYYLITILGNEDGTVEESVYSHWVGFTKTKPPREIRKASLISKPEAVRALFHEINEPTSIVNDERDLYVFLLIGGHGLITESIAKKVFSELVSSKEVNRSFSKGFIHSNSLPSHKKNHAPTKKTRMQVLKRDNFRCKVCGRSPNDYVDIELHVHHIIPWGGRYSGITEEDNLITLCNTCHDGLDPHFEPMLFDLLGIKPLYIAQQNQYVNRLKLYMNIVRKEYLKQ